jgi:hypothetical protein
MLYYLAILLLRNCLTVFHKLSLGTLTLPLFYNMKRFISWVYNTIYGPNVERRLANQNHALIALIISIKVSIVKYVLDCNKHSNGNLINYSWVWNDNVTIFVFLYHKPDNVINENTFVC